MNRLKSKLVIALLAICFCLQSFADEYVFVDKGGAILASHPLDLSFCHVVGRGIGYNDGYSSLNLFWRPCRLFDGYVQPFVDIRGHVFNNGRPAANVGIGMRVASPCLCGVFGINVFYDYRQGHRINKHTHRRLLGSHSHQHRKRKQGQRANFQQVGIGFEALTRIADFRLNGYLPISTIRTNFDKTDFLYPGNFFAECIQQERALAGGDFEVGVSVWHRNPCEILGVYAAAGPYYYTGNCVRNVIGCQGRIAVELWDYVSLEVRGSYDKVYHGNVQGVFCVTFPFETWLCTALCKKPRWMPPPSDREKMLFLAAEAKRDSHRMADYLLKTLGNQPVVRQEIIVLDRGCVWRDNFSRSELQREVSGFIR